MQFRKLFYLFVALKCCILFIYFMWPSENEYDPFAKLSLVNKSSFGATISYLYLANAFLIDLDVLNSIKLNDKEKLNLLPINGPKRTDFINQSESLHIVFGIFQENLRYLNFNRFKNILNQTYGLNCEYETQEGINFDKTVKTVVYFNCGIFKIQMCIFHERGDFFWIGRDTNRFDNPKWFCDVNRAVKRFNLSQIENDYLGKILIPASIDHFLFDYKYSAFIECEHNLAKNLSKAYNKVIDEHRESSILKTLRYITNVLEGMQKKYILYGGTLLGWYRDCGLFPYASDADISIWNNEYESRIFDTFHGNKNARLIATFSVNNSNFGLEIRLKGDLVWYDMFMFHAGNETHEWTPYYVGWKLIKQWVQKFDICCGEMKGYRFFVPCNPSEYLEREYGNWTVPLSSGYNWLNLDFDGAIELSSDPMKTY